MSASMLSSASVATTRNTTVAQATTVAPFSGLKSLAAFPVTRKTVDITTLANNGGRVRCMKVWPPEGKKKFETLSYLPPLTDEQLLKEVDYLLRKGWVPCLEFQTQNPYPHREHFHGGGYYDGRYWTMWKLPMFGCTDAAQVLKELQEAKKEYPHAYIRILGFDAVRQVQCIMFIAHQPK